MAKKRTAFVALNHLCWFSRKYKDKTVKQVIQTNPEYIKWCIENLKHLRFHGLIKVKLNERG